MGEEKRAETNTGRRGSSEAASIGSRFQMAASQVNQWLWSQPAASLSPLKRMLWILSRILFIVINESKKDRLSLRASSLTFTIVLSLVPTLALGTAVLKGLGAGGHMKEAAYRIIDQMEKSGGHNAPLQTGPAQNEAAGQSGSPASPPTITSHLKKATDTIFSYVERTNFATLGAFGIAGLVFTVLSVLGNIETSMNAIWQADSGRPFGRKMIDYLALIVLLPISINLTLAAGTILQSPKLFAHIQQIIPVLWLQGILLTLLPAIIVVSTFTLLYRFLPNTRVNFFPALVGGLAGGAGWFALQSVYITMQIGVARYNAIYGSFATLPLFLVWLYMGWLVFLAGAEVAFAVQVWPQYVPDSTRLTPLKKMTIAFETVAAIFGTFQHRQVATQKMLAATLNQPEGDVAKVLEELEEAGIIHHIQEKRREGFVPAAPAEALPASEIIKMVMGQEKRNELHHPLAVRAMEAALASVADKKIELPIYLRKTEAALPDGISQPTLFAHTPHPASAEQKDRSAATPPPTEPTRP